MKLHDLKGSRGARTDRKRVGRGVGSGSGKTSGRGTKGQLSRTGGRTRPGFEGGQNPIYQRMPFKRGFRNRFKKEFETVNLRKIVEFEMESPITPESLFERGITKSLATPVKILGSGDVTTALTIRAHKFTKSAQEKIESAGGTAEVIE